MVDTDSLSLLPDIRHPEDAGRPPHRQSMRRERSFPMEGKGALPTCPDNPGKCLHLSNKQIGKKCT
ncbi:hypothetical protein CXU03_09695 [Akkermansia muciniphila]|nr:hypothetical protein CXU03_09695 [Akkermansia muciniphila]